MFGLGFFPLIGYQQAWKINTVVTALNLKQKLQKEKEYLKNYVFFLQMRFKSCKALLGQKKPGRKPDSKEALLLTGGERLARRNRREK